MALYEAEVSKYVIIISGHRSRTKQGAHRQIIQKRCQGNLRETCPAAIE